MKRAVLFFLFSLLSVSTVFSQGVTYNHDELVCDKFVDNSEMLEALRGEFYLPLSLEKPHAEAIDSSLNKRMRVEALNMADRTPSVLDVAYMTEKKKIERQLNSFRKDVMSISREGGSGDSQVQWLERYNAINCGLQAVRDAYMPISERKVQYLAIYRDLIQQHLKLLDYINYLRYVRQVRKAGGTSPVLSKSRIGSIANSAYGRWKLAQGVASSGGSH